MDLINRLETWILHNRKDLYDTLQPGLRDEQISEMEGQLEVTLPDEFKAFYRWRNGQALDDIVPVLNNYTICEAEEVVDVNRMLTELLQGGAFERANWWNPAWVPFLANGAGDYYCVDMAGAFDGVKGQVLEFNHDYESRTIHHASFALWLETLVEALEQGHLLNGDYGMEPDADHDALYERINPGYPLSKYAG